MSDHDSYSDAGFGSRGGVAKASLFYTGRRVRRDFLQGGNGKQDVLQPRFAA